MAYQQGSHGGNFIPSNVDATQGSAVSVGQHGGAFVPGASQYPRAQFQSTYQQTQHPTMSPVNPVLRTVAYSPPPGAYQNTSSQPAPHGIGSAPRQQSVQVQEMARPHMNATAVAVPASNSFGVDEYKDRQLVLRPTEFKGIGNIFENNMMYRWFRKPHWVRRSGLMYDSTQHYYHRDAMDREYTGEKDYRYIDPKDGKIKALVVQCVDDILSGTGNGTWKRTYIRNVTPIFYRVAMWPFNHLDMREGTLKSQEDWALVIAKWIPTCILLTIGVLFVSAPKWVDRAGYESFNYKYWGYPKVARNEIEEDPANRNQLLTAGMEINRISKRLLKPRYLCVLTDPANQELRGWKVENCVQQYQSEKPPSYIFVAYTAEQFRTKEDLTILLQLAEKAARNAGVSGFWIGCSCMREPEQVEDDVYRISDIIRGCDQVAIVVGPSASNPSIVTPDHMLHQWGTRIWTFPEVLLAPAGKPIMVYCSRRDVAPFSLEKKQFAAKVWDDSEISRQMIDHYEGNLILSRLELVILALECLQTRNTMQYLPGDYSYVLMGLLRMRPRVDRTDSAFQAFARLSLANDSDRLLERLIGTLPAHSSQPWHSMKDAYGTKLWDIEPTVGIAGIGQDDTVIVDGAWGASVRWKGFKQVAYRKRLSFKRRFAYTLLRISGILWYLSIFLLAFSGMASGLGSGSSSDSGSGSDSGTGYRKKRSVTEDLGDASLRRRSSGIPFLSGVTNLMVTFGAIMIVVSTIAISVTPYLVGVVFGGKLRDTQAWLFAFEGYLPIEDIEKQIFGAKLHRLEWAPYGSPLSRHRRNKHGECCGIDPTEDPNVKALVNWARASQYGEQKIFTLVDTNTMTVTLFSAVNPPIGFLIVGSEGGMQRAVGVSLDWTTGTLYRETVLRMETPILSRMERVPRVKIGLRRSTERVHMRPQY